MGISDKELMEKFFQVIEARESGDPLRMREMVLDKGEYLKVKELVLGRYWNDVRPC